MDERYTVLFEEVAGHRCGSVVLGSRISADAGGIAYLLRVGAVCRFARVEDVEEAHAAALLENEDRDAVDAFPGLDRSAIDDPEGSPTRAMARRRNAKKEEV